MLPDYDCILQFNCGYDCTSLLAHSEDAENNLETRALLGDMMQQH